MAGEYKIQRLAAQRLTSEQSVLRSVHAKKEVERSAEQQGLQTSRVGKLHLDLHMGELPAELRGRRMAPRVVGRPSCSVPRTPPLTSASSFSMSPSSARMRVR